MDTSSFLSLSTFAFLSGQFLSGQFGSHRRKVLVAEMRKPSQVASLDLAHRILVGLLGTKRHEIGVSDGKSCIITRSQQ